MRGGAFTVEEAAALVPGRAALILAAILRGSLRNGLSLNLLLADMGLDPVNQAAAFDAYRALEETGERWRCAQLPQRGNAETGDDEIGVASDSLIMVDSTEAGTLLGIGPRRVTQLAAAGVLEGTKTAHGWRFPRSEVVGLRELRQAEAA